MKNRATFLNQIYRHVYNQMENQLKPESTNKFTVVVYIVTYPEMKYDIGMTSW